MTGLEYIRVDRSVNADNDTLRGFGTQLSGGS